MKVEKPKQRWRWRLFQAKDFQGLMWPVCFFCYMLGLFPYKMNSSSFLFSKPRFVFSTLITAAYAGYLAIVLYQTDISRTLEYDSIPGMLQGNFYYILGCVITVVSYALSRPRMQVLQDLAEMSSRLPPETFRKLARWIHAKDILGFLFLVVHVPNVISANVYQSLANVIALYTAMVIFLMDMFYMNCVCVLKACFTRINQN